MYCARLAPYQLPFGKPVITIVLCDGKKMW